MAECTWAGLTIEYNNTVVMPSAPLAELLPNIVPYCKGKVLDLATGSGCIAKWLETTECSEIHASDISQMSCSMARKNTTRTKVIQADWYSGLARDYDLIVCNPPYGTTREWQVQPQFHELLPQISVDGGITGTDAIKTVISGSVDRLVDNGYLVVAHDESQAEWVKQQAGDSLEYVCTWTHWQSGLTVFKKI
jgi:HemK-like putative methylase